METCITFYRRHICRQEVLNKYRKTEINSIFHFAPLHSYPGGIRYGRAHVNLDVTTHLSEKLIRFPLWFEISTSQQDQVAEVLNSFSAE